MFMHQDKIFHMGAYFIMAIFAWRVFNEYLSKPKVIIITSLFFCSLYGVSDEWHQSLVPGREADLLDWVADTLGALIALSMLHYYRVLKKTAT